MSFEYNSEEVRRVAKEIERIAQNVKKLSTDNVKKMRGTVQDSLKGDAANALEDVLTDLSSDINKIGNGLDGLYKALMEYARRAELADLAAKKAIEG